MRVWSEADRQRIAGLLKRGKSAREIGEVFGVSRNSIAGLVFRDKTLNAIGFLREGRGYKGGRKKHLTDEEREERKRIYRQRWIEKRRQKNKLRALPPLPPPLNGSSPRLRVVSNNITMMVDDWLKRNGGARRFERGETADPLAVRVWLRERGVDCVGAGQAAGRAYLVSRNGGRQKRMSWPAVLDMVDKMRQAEGLEPFKAA